MAPTNSLALVAAVAVMASTADAFTSPMAFTSARRALVLPPLFAEENTSTGAAFVPPPEVAATDDTPVEAETKEEQVDLATVESLGRGAAKVGIQQKR